jgi:hypothetical protein
MQRDLSALIASLAEIIARLKFVHHELQSNIGKHTVRAALRRG